MRVVRPRGCCLVGRLGRVPCFSVVWLVGRLRLACGWRVVGLGSVRLVLGGAVGRLCWGFACGVLPPPPVVALVVSLLLALAAGLGRAVLGVAAGVGALSPLPFCGCLARWLAVGSVGVAGGRWCLAPLRVLVGAGAVVACLRRVWVWVLVLALVWAVVAAVACFVGWGLAGVLAGAGFLVLVVLCGVWRLCVGLWLCVLFLFAFWVRGSRHWVARRAVVADEK